MHVGTPVKIAWKVAKKIAPVPIAKTTPRRTTTLPKRKGQKVVLQLHQPKKTAEPPAAERHNRC